MVARVREDRLLRWSAYAAVPVLWLALALVNPFLLLVPPVINASSLMDGDALRRDRARTTPSSRTTRTSSRRPGYSTVTVFARLRGWSTFRPRRRAIR